MKLPGTELETDNATEFKVKNECWSKILANRKQFVHELLGEFQSVTGIVENTPIHDVVLDEALGERHIVTRLQELVWKFECYLAYAKESTHYETAMIDVLGWWLKEVYIDYSSLIDTFSPEKTEVVGGILSVLSENEWSKEEKAQFIADFMKRRNGK